MVLIVKCLKTFSLLQEVREAFKILSPKEHFIKDVLKMLYNSISPRFLYRAKLLPPEGGRFEGIAYGIMCPAKSGTYGAIWKSSFSCSSKDYCSMYCMMNSSVTLPELAAK